MGVYLVTLLNNLRFYLSFWDSICNRKRLRYVYCETVGVFKLNTVQAILFWHGLFIL